MDLSPILESPRGVLGPRGSPPAGVEPVDVDPSGRIQLELPLAEPAPEDVLRACGRTVVYVKLPDAGGVLSIPAGPGDRVATLLARLAVASRAANPFVLRR